MKNLICFLATTSIYSFCFAAMTSTGAISSATGGTGRGAAEAVDSVLLNPSIVANLPSKFLSANYNKERWALTISDNGREALFPAAISFVRSDINEFKIQQLALSLAYAINKRISIGTTISMYEYDQTAQHIDIKNRQTNSDIGIMLIPFANSGIGLTANNIAQSETELSKELQPAKTLGIGTHYTYQSFARFRFDVESAPEYKTDQLVFMGGIETLMTDFIILRFGYQNNNVIKKNFSSAGLGFAGPQFGLHYSYNANVADNSDYKHSIDLGIPF